MTDDDVAAARRRFAEELRHTARVRSPAVVEPSRRYRASASPDPGPWRILEPDGHVASYRTTADADPRHLYHDVLVAIDAARRLNNGQPGLWAALYDRLGLAAGAHVVHVGAGTGYYSAVLAEVVGREGRVTAVEIDPCLAGRARRNLAPGWPQAAVVAADGFAFRPDRPADAIVVNAGVSHLSPAWLDALAADGGRLLVPLTDAEGRGRLPPGHPAGRRDAPLPRPVRGPDRDHPVRRRARSRGRGAAGGGPGEVGPRRRALAATRPRGAGRGLLAGRRRLVALDRARPRRGGGDGADRRRGEPAVVSLIPGAADPPGSPPSGSSCRASSPPRGERAGVRFLEFFAAAVRNPHTRRAYARAVADFLAWCERRACRRSQPCSRCTWRPGSRRRRVRLPPGGTGAAR